ncbi:hypothetical protein GGS20DRAFT_200016 [Poronia punctata]|nr:hypothetical protein GGS20DRAFT_200016 [Poronia punctata]
MSSVRGIHLLRTTRIGPSHLINNPSRRSPFLRHGRAFHWQSTVGAAIEGTQDIIVSLHTATHLPWFMTIPLVAVSVGVVFRLPFTYYTRLTMQRRAELRPIFQAWNVRIMKEVNAEMKGQSDSKITSVVKARLDKVMKRVHGKLGLQQWKLYSGFLSFPFWLLAIDGVRRLCGGPRGLIGSLITGADSDGGKAATLATHVDPTLAVEGCLWFPDLTAPDPYHILPFALSATLLWNMLPETRQQLIDRFRIASGRQAGGMQSNMTEIYTQVAFKERMQSTFYLTLIGLATLVGPLTMDLPAALHLYWVVSSATNALTSMALKKLMPINAQFLERCKGVELPIIRPQRPKSSAKPKSTS